MENWVKKVIGPVVVAELKPVVDAVNNVLALVKAMQQAIDQVRRQQGRIDDLLRETNLCLDKAGITYAFTCPNCGRASSFAPDTTNCRRCGEQVVKKTLDS